MPISEAHLSELEAQLEACLACESGVLLLECGRKRARFLSNFVLVIKRRTLIESTQIYRPGEPLYAKSLYDKVSTMVTDTGLLLVRREEPELDPGLLILRAGLAGIDHRVNPATRADLLKFVRTKKRLIAYANQPDWVVEAIQNVGMQLVGDTLLVQSVAARFRTVEIPREQMLSVIKTAVREEE